MNQPGLIIFIKNPVKGKVKTRLASGIGEDGALKVYLKLLSLTRDVTRNLKCKRFLFYSDSITANDDWEEGLFQKELQTHGDLGAKMEAAFKHVFLSGYDPVLIIGSDCPGISAEIIQQGITALHKNDFVIGPSPDGGYYLLGMKHFENFLFPRIKWSTHEVLAETKKRIDKSGKKYFLLPELMDIDTPEDFTNYLLEKGF